MPAAGALQQRCPHRPRFVVPASRTTKTLRPAELTQILSTGLLGGETRLELGQIPRIIFHFPDPTSCGHLSQVNTHLAQIIDRRMAAEMDGEFVVFLIGMRINKPWKLHKWLPVFLAMPRMIEELEANPDSGFLGHNGISMGVIVQYWRSFEHLEAYARNKNQEHWPAWMAFNERVGASRGDVGIWHETYVVKPGQYEAVYSGMPTYGLGRVGKLVPASGRTENARDRLGAGAEAG